MIRSWNFQQKKYIKKYGLDGIGELGQGVCISLSCRWAKMILKSKKTFFGSSPDLSEEQRTTYFNKGTVPMKVGRNQLDFDRLRGSAEETMSSSKEALREARELFNQGEITWEEYEKLSKGVFGGAGDAGLESEHSLQLITAANKLKIVESTMCQSFDEYFIGVSAASCYIFSSDDLNHAMAGYVTKGSFSPDYLFFDPNSGEFRAGSGSEIAVVMAKFKNHYAKQGHPLSKCKRIKVEYTGTKTI